VVIAEKLVGVSLAGDREASASAAPDSTGCRVLKNGLA
jgi:hypothetical protein